MNSVVIKKVEYRLFSEEEFSSFDTIPQSGSLTEDCDETAHGPLHKTAAQFDLANVTAEIEATIKRLRGRQLQFRITDTNAVVHLVGEEFYCARLKYTKTIDRTPGSFNGYHCTVTCNSPTGSLVS